MEEISIKHGDKFDITIQKWNTSEFYKMKVEFLYQSEQVYRFKITGGDRFMNMDKVKYGKTWKWKITGKNFEFSTDIKLAAWTIQQIQDEIEYRLNPPKNYKNPKWVNK